MTEIMNLEFFSGAKLNKHGTAASKRHKKPRHCCTATQLPFLQALVRSEGEANMTDNFEVACRVGKSAFAEGARGAGLDERKIGLQCMPAAKKFAKCG